MTRPPQRELFVSERPIRSDYSRERSYARRRIATVTILLLVLGGISYALWGHTPRNQADIPTIKAEAPYKQKPTDPGGIDIPHQDVRVYDELESKTTPQPQIEHLLPPPETPKDMPPPAPPVLPAPVAVAPTPMPVPTAAIVSAPVPMAVPVSTVATTVQSSMASSPVKTTPLSPAPSAPILPKVDPTPSIEQIIAKTKAEAVSPSAPVKAVPAPVAAGSLVVQLASVPDEAKAQAMMQNLQQKYAAQLGDVILRLTRADLGTRGIYYRIQSQSIAEDDANHICSSLKQMNAGCILVRK